MKTISSQKLSRLRALLNDLEFECSTLNRPILAYLLEMVRIEIEGDQASDSLHGNGRDRRD